MTPAQRRRKFGAERTRQLRAFGKLTAQTRRQIIRELNDARDQVIATLRGTPTTWQLSHLQKVRKELEAAIARFEDQGAATWRSSTAAAWERGVSMVDEPLRAAAVSAVDVLPRISDAQLGGIQAFTTNRIRDIGEKTRTKVNAHLLATLSGAQSTSETINHIQAVFRSSRKRAITITRTELGRAFSQATQLRQESAAKRVPGLKKQWRRSGKLHSRITHDAIDGQIREVDEPFQIGEELLMFPRDPTGSARNTINCGCTSLPYVEDWEEVANPGRTPFTREEVAVQPMRRDLNALPTGPVPAPPAFLSKGIKGNPSDVVMQESNELRALGAFFQRHPIKTVVLKQGEISFRQRARKMKKDLESDLDGYLGKRSLSLTTTSRPAKVNGFTFRDHDHVVIKTKAKTDFSKASVKRARIAVANAITDWTPRTNASGQRFVRQRWSLSSEFPLGSVDQQLVTWFHEMAHQIHYKLGKPDRPIGLSSLTAYANYNSYEWHAEHIAAWLLDRDALARWNQDVVDYLDELLAPFINQGGP